MINNVVRGNVIGKGASGKIYKGTWEGTPCAIKEIHSIFAELASENEFAAFKSAFIEECRRSSRLRHPNIVQFLGVYFQAQNVHTLLHGLPCLVMELLYRDLTAFLIDNPVISYGIKLSILNDVALGLRFLHSSTPVIIHRDLSSNNVLVSRGFVAKIGDLGTARFLNPKSEAQLSRVSQMTKAPGTVDFMSPEVLFDNPQYGTPLDVFSFACVSLHTITHQWPSPTAPVYTDPVTSLLQPRSEVERRSLFFDKFDNEALSLKPLLMRCLNNDPKARPRIVEVCENLLKLRGTNFAVPLPNVLGRDDLQSQSDFKYPFNGTKANSGPENATTTYWNQLDKNWNECASLPKKLQADTVTATGGKVYIKTNYEVFCYCSDKDTWSALPLMPVLGSCIIYTGKHLLSIGGIIANRMITKKVYLFSDAGKCWSDACIASKMEVARFGATAVAYQSLVIIIGGTVDANLSTTQTVEVLKVIPENLSSSHWCTVQPMPFGTSIPMTTIISGTLFVAGGYTLRASMCCMASVSIKKLLNTKDNTSNIWSDVTHLPCSTLSFISYKEHLLIFGGDYIKGASDNQFTWHAVTSIYMFHSKTQQWEKVGKIPCKHYLGRCAHLTPSKIIFVGGQTDVCSTSVDILVTQCVTLELDDGTESLEDYDIKDSSTLKLCQQQ